MTSVSTTIEPTPTLAIVNARVWTGDERRPWADAVLVTGDRISAVGSSAEVRKAVRPMTRVIDANGAMLTPGPDVVSQLLMAAPMVVLYNGSILIAFVVTKRRERRIAAEGPPPDDSADDGADKY